MTRPIPGANISVRSHRETTVYRTCWCVEVEDLDALRRLIGGTPIEVQPPIHAGTDAPVRILEGPPDGPAADVTASTDKRPSYG